LGSPFSAFKFASVLDRSFCALESAKRYRSVLKFRQGLSESAIAAAALGFDRSRIRNVKHTFVSFVSACGHAPVVEQEELISQMQLNPFLG
jgi:hypothetical protein